ncbi:MAG: hypothetical protein AB7P18_24690, partial [Candidatus Binatia bacterium]
LGLVLVVELSAFCLPLPVGMRCYGDCSIASPAFPVRVVCSYSQRMQKRRDLLQENGKGETDKG